MDRVALIGTGFVADLYMRSLESFPEIRIVGAWDHDPARLAAFCAYWKLPAAQSMQALLDVVEADGLVLNLTNPGSHYEVSKACLLAGRHVYSEKPLAMRMDQANELHRLAMERGLFLASAPCSYLSQSAQTLRAAVQSDAIGKPLLVYAELDDDFITQAPYRKWASESGAPWPYRDEFLVGCTLEHAGYYITWLMMIFGSVDKVLAASAEVVPNKLPDLARTAPDFSAAVLFFKSGVVARLTCSIVAPHDHRLRLYGERGILELDDCWDNEAPVRVRRRHVIRRKLLTSPIARTVKPVPSGQPTVKRRGAARMNFALGPRALLTAIHKQESPQAVADFALHLNEVTLAIQDAHDAAGVQRMATALSSLDGLPGVPAAPGGQALL